jgi:hypothetical protein
MDQCAIFFASNQYRKNKINNQYWVNESRGLFGERDQILMKGKKRAENDEVFHRIKSMYNIFHIKSIQEKIK